MRIACWIRKTRPRMQKPSLTHTRTYTLMRTFVQKYVYFLLFHGNGSVNAPQCYVIRTSHVLFFSTAIMVTRTRLSNTFKCTLPVCFILTYKSFIGNSFLCAYEIVVFRELNIYVTVLCCHVYSLMLIIHNVVKKKY